MKIKTKILLAFAVIALLVMLPLASSAATFKSGESIMVSEETNDDLYVGANQVSISKPVVGDLFVAGSIISVNNEATIEKDAFVGGSQVILDSEIKDDLKAAGGQVTINGNVAGDLMVAGGMVVVNGDVNGDVYAAGGQVELSGVVKGNVKASIGTLYLKPTALIEGRLEYSSETEAISESGAKVIGETKFNKIEKRNQGISSNWLVLTSSFFGVQFPVVWILMVIALTLLTMFVVFAAPLKSRDVADYIINKPGRSIGFGFIYLIVTPIVCLILIVLGVTFPIALLICFIFAASLIAGHALLAFFIGAKLMKLFNKGVDENKKSFLLLSALVGSVILSLVMIIPFIGFLLVLIGMIFTMGALVNVTRPLFYKKRSWTPESSENKLE